MRLNVFLLIAFLLSVAANLLVQPVSTRPNFEFIPEMVRTSAYKAYSSHPGLPGQRTLQPPPENSVPRGHEEPKYGPGPSEALRAAVDLTNPISAEDLDAAARGAELYRIYCMPCHGTAGRGDGPVAMRGFPAPPPLNNQKALAMRDGQIFHLISYGQNNMPGYAVQIEAGDRWKAVLHVRALQQRLESPTAAPPAGQTPKEDQP